MKSLNKLALILLLLLLYQCEQQPTLEEINLHSNLKNEKNIDSLIVNYKNFKDKFPESKFLNSEYDSPDNIGTRIYDYCLKENSLFLWEKAIPVLDNSVKYVINDDIITNRKTYDKLSKTRNTNDTKRFLDSLLPNRKFKNSFLSLPYKEVQSLYNEIERDEENIENTKMKNEEYAWDFVLNKNTIESCRKYLEFHPNGKHKKEVIDIEVHLIFKGDYGRLPSMVSKNGVTSSISQVTILNSTPYKLTVLYSGIISERVVIERGQSKSIKLTNGSYKIAASVDNYRVKNFAGTEVISLNNYEVEYYIKTNRY